MNRILGAAISLFALTWAAPASAVGGWIHEVSGEVMVTVGDGVPGKAVKNTEVTSDTIIKTGDKSTVVLKFEDGQVISMQANSTLKVNKYFYNPKTAKNLKNKKLVARNSAFFTAIKGGMRFVTGLIGKANKASFKLATPTATIGIRGTDFMTIVQQPSKLDVSVAAVGIPPIPPTPVFSQVASGGISITNSAGTLALGAGKTAVVASVTTMPALVSAAALPASVASSFNSLFSLPVPPSLPAVAPPAAPVTPVTPAAPPVTTAPPVAAPPVAAAPVPPVPAAVAPAGTGAAATGATATGTTAAGTTAATGAAAGTGAAATTTAAAAATGAITTTTVVAGAAAVAVVGAAVGGSSSSSTTGTTGTTGTQ